MVLEKTLESPLDNKEIKPINPKGNQPWIFIGRTDAEVPMPWLLDMKSRLTRRNLDAGEDWRQKVKRVGQEFEQTRGDSEGWGVWWAAVHGVTKSWTQLSNWTTTKIWSGLLFSMLFISLHCSVDYMGNHFLSCGFEVLLLISSLHWLQSVNPLCCHFPHNFLHWRVFFFLVSLSPVGLPIIASSRLLPQCRLEQSLNLEF